MNGKIRFSGQATDDSISEFSEDDSGVIDLVEEDKTIYITGTLHDKQTAAFFRYWSKLEWLFEEKKIEKPLITIIINSDGGGVFQGLAINNKIQSSIIPARTIGAGRVSSAAILIYLAGRERLLYKDTLIGFHRTQPDLERNEDRNVVEQELATCRKIDERSHRIILANSELTRARLYKMEREEYNMVAEEAVKFGLAHEIIPSL